MATGDLRVRFCYSASKASREVEGKPGHLPPQHTGTRLHNSSVVQAIALNYKTGPVGTLPCTEMDWTKLGRKVPSPFKV